MIVSFGLEISQYISNISDFLFTAIRVFPFSFNRDTKAASYFLSDVFDIITRATNINVGDEIV